MKYSDLLNELNGLKEAQFAEFQRKLIPTKQAILGVRTPALRSVAKKYGKEWQTLLDFPDEYYEVTFLKLTAISLLPFEEFVLQIERCVSLMDNWAACDCFKAKCIGTHREEFLPVLERLMNGGEFYQRYVLVTLLGFYCEERYLPLIFERLERADHELFYVHMAAAWLTAEVLVKCYDKGVEWLKEKRLPARSHNKAIQKARESFRLNDEQKSELLKLKRR